MGAAADREVEELGGDETAGQHLEGDRGEGHPEDAEPEDQPPRDGSDRPGEDLGGFDRGEPDPLVGGVEVEGIRRREDDEADRDHVGHEHADQEVDLRERAMVPTPTPGQ